MLSPSILCAATCRHDATVRVINCDGSASSSAVIAGLEWLAQNAQLPAVASLCLGSDSPNQALDDAVSAVIALGITAVVAAGNYNQGEPCNCMYVTAYCGVFPDSGSHNNALDDAVLTVIALSVTSAVAAADNHNQGALLHVKSIFD